MTELKNRRNRDLYHSHYQVCFLQKLPFRLNIDIGKIIKNVLDKINKILVTTASGKRNMETQWLYD